MLHPVHLIERRYGRPFVRMLLLASAIALLLGLGLQGGAPAADGETPDANAATVAQRLLDHVDAGRCAEVKPGAMWTSTPARAGAARGHGEGAIGPDAELKPYPVLNHLRIAGVAAWIGTH